jgi:hypothetical protein
MSFSNKERHDKPDGADVFHARHAPEASAIGNGYCAMYA